VIDLSGVTLLQLKLTPGFVTGAPILTLLGGAMVAVVLLAVVPLLTGHLFSLGISAGFEATACLLTGSLGTTCLVIVLVLSIAQLSNV
tara:strand:+ start:1379 stop:1642 length:264 start_codon:yes stop_codon:yes gene_type:complete